MLQSIISGQWQNINIYMFYHYMAQNYWDINKMLYRPALTITEYEISWVWSSKLDKSHTGLPLLRWVLLWEKYFIQNTQTDFNVHIVTVKEDDDSELQEWKADMTNANADVFITM